jgi:predicted enzyme related to lactoylglutathione lyase
MIKGLDSIMLNSMDAKKLADFYEKKVGLVKGEEFEMGDKGESYFEFKVKPVGFGIADHSQIKGKSKEGKRILLNFEVDDIDKDVMRLMKNGVKVVQGKYHIEGYGWIATFEDLDGNYFQLVQVREN